MKPIGDRLAQGWNAADRRVAAERAEMLLQDGTEKRRDEPLGLAEREIERCGAGLDPVEQTREALEGRGDNRFEMRLRWARKSWLGVRA